MTFITPMASRSQPLSIESLLQKQRQEKESASKVYKSRLAVVPLTHIYAA